MQSKSQIMLLFIHLCTSLHLPYSITSQPCVNYVDDSTLQRLVKEKDFVIPIVIDDNDTDSEFLFIYAKLSVEFYGKATFVAVRNSEAEYLNKFGSPEIPYISIIKDHSVKAVLPLKQNINSITVMIRNWLDNPRRVNNLEELERLIGDCQYTVISKNENYEEGMELITSAYRPYGVIEVIIVSDDLFNELGLDNYKFGLFRLMDNVIAPFSNISQFLEATKPLYSILNDEDLYNNPNVTYAAIFDDKFRENYHEIFYNLSLEYPEFSFVIVKTHFDYYKLALKKDVTEFSFLIFNYDLGYYYNPPSNTSFKEYLEKVKTGKVEKSYFSEEINEVPNDFLTKKVVGKNYEDFVNDKVDVLMIYSSEDPIYFVGLLEDIARKYGEELKIKFGYINPELNSSPKTLPKYYKLPHVELFPRNDKENSIPLFGELSSNAIIRLLKKNCVNGNKIKISEQNYEDMLHDYKEVSDSFYKLPFSLRPKARKYLDEIEMKLNK